MFTIRYKCEKLNNFSPMIMFKTQKKDQFAENQFQDYSNAIKFKNN